MNSGRSEPHNTNERVVVVVAVTTALVGLLSSVLWDAVRYEDGRFIAHSADLVTIGAGKARLFQVAMAADMVGSYLLFLPLVIYLWRRFRVGNEFAVDIISTAGVAYVIVGAAGAAVLASAGPPLIRAYASAQGVDTAPIITTFSTLSDAVLGVWQLLAGLLLATWWLGIGFLARDQWRWFARLSVGFGALTLVAVIAGMSTVDHDSSAPTTLVFLPLVLWPAAFALVLSRSSRVDI